MNNIQCSRLAAIIAVFVWLLSCGFEPAQVTTPEPPENLIFELELSVNEVGVDKYDIDVAGANADIYVIASEKEYKQIEDHVSQPELSGSVIDWQTCTIDEKGKCQVRLYASKVELSEQHMQLAILMRLPYDDMFPEDVDSKYLLLRWDPPGITFEEYENVHCRYVLSYFDNGDPGASILMDEESKTTCSHYNGGSGYALNGMPEASVSEIENMPSDRGTAPTQRPILTSTPTVTPTDVLPTAMPPTATPLPFAEKAVFTATTRGGILVIMLLLALVGASLAAWLSAKKSG